MKTKYNLPILILVFLVSISCDFKSKIAIIKNNTSGLIIGTSWPGGLLTDSILYNDSVYMTYWLEPHANTTISVPGGKLNTAADSIKDYLYFFDKDSLDKYKKIKQYSGILKASLLKEIKIQLNKVKEPLDTIYINSPVTSAK